MSHLGQVRSATDSAKVIGSTKSAARGKGRKPTIVSNEDDDVDDAGA